jgi:hypothetical protein
MTAIRSAWVPRALLFAGAALVAASLGAPLATAHHSLAKFDGSRVVKIEGTVTAFRWVNPHASLTVDGTADGDAPDGAWAIEMNPPGMLMGQGWTSDSIATGDKVTVFVNPPRDAAPLADGSVRGLYVGIILADGSTFGTTDPVAGSR